MEKDLAKARKIVHDHGGPWVGQHGALQENSAKAVAEGIALGRKEGLALAAKAIAEAEKDL